MDAEERSRLPAILKFLQNEHAHLSQRFEEDRRALMNLARELKKAKPKTWVETEQARIARLFKAQRRMRHLERRIATVTTLLQVQYRFAGVAAGMAKTDATTSTS
ncbi:MAG TPA: hypothetical protein VLN59_13470 [Burkholderiales bacterium]|nr:hypothetical protein [Burkholderiales bacterium]